MKSELSIDEFGNKFYKFPNGILHRENGPAVEFGNGSKYWYLNNIQYSEKEYKCKMRSIILSKLFK